MENTIFTQNDETLGFYEDIKNGYIKLIKEFTEKEDFEEVTYLIEQLKEINEFEESTKLLILSNNNGMGFTCKEFKQ